MAGRTWTEVTKFGGECAQCTDADASMSVHSAFCQLHLTLRFEKELLKPVATLATLAHQWYHNHGVGRFMDIGANGGIFT